MPISVNTVKKTQLAKFQRTCLWMLFGLVWLAFSIDVLFGFRFLFAKGFVLGALLAYVMQSLFTFFSHRQTYHNRGTRKAASQMMGDMYVALIAKWVVGMVGFALIFMFLKKEVMSFAVFVGFGLMQLGIFIGFYQLGKNSKGNG